MSSLGGVPLGWDVTLSWESFPEYKASVKVAVHLGSTFLTSACLLVLSEQAAGK